MKTIDLATFFQRKIINSVFILCSLAGALNTTAQPTAADQQLVNSLLKKMTLEEKVGQMTQVTLAVFAKGAWANEDGTLDAAALKKAVNQYQVGSMLNTTAHALPLTTWHTIITQILNETKNNRLQIPVLYGLDAIHGQTYTLDATLFPQNLAMAATRNPELVKAISAVTAKELRASGVRWNFAPVLDIGRQPLWSRFPETYGEDVFMGKTMGAAAIKGYEENGLRKPDAVASCMKHFLGYSAPRTGKDRTPTYLPEIELREYYLPQFREAIKAGASSIMINSGEINGVPVHASKALLTDLLGKELGFEGLIVTDWEDIKRLHNWHRIAATPREAVVKAINAGIDMSMVPSDYSFYDLLIEAVKKGEVPMSRIDDAVKRILMLKAKVGLFENAYPEENAKAQFGNASYQTLALETAREAMTLLKNQHNILPLAKNTKVLIAGPGTQNLGTLNGSWSYTWQGNDEKWYPADSKNILQAITEKVGATNIITTSKKGYNEAANFDGYALKAAANNADVIVLCLGENAYAESPGNIPDLALDDNQTKLAEAAIATGKPVVLVLTEGRPRFITGIEPGIKGILMAYWSGKKTAEAIADVLFGDYNPNGKLPFSYPRSMGEIVLYDRKGTEDVREVFNDNINTGYQPLYAFGHGLSYTQFTYSSIALNQTTLKANQTITATITITNSGSKKGKHSVELYTRDLYASITPNAKRLRAFQKIELNAGESKTISFTLSAADLAFVNAQLQTVTEPGDFEIYIGDQKAAFSYQ